MKLQWTVQKTYHKYYCVLAGTGRNDAGNCDHWAPSPAYASELSCYSTVSTGTSNRPLPPEEEREQFLMGTSYQGNYMEQIDPSLQQPHFTSPSDVGRKWHNLRRRCYHPKRSNNFTFKVVSYNVLADDLLHSNSYLYNGAEEWFKHWEYRRRNLLQELSYYNADVSDVKYKKYRYSSTKSWICASYNHLAFTHEQNDDSVFKMTTKQSFGKSF